MEIDNELTQYECLKNSYKEIQTEDAIIDVTCNNPELLKLIKHDLQDKIISKIQKFYTTGDVDERNAKAKKSKLTFFKNFIVDHVGEIMKTWETGICEGWQIPKYENEYQTLLGLPNTEDKPPGDTMRIRKPNQECFNCLATSHKIQDCPIKQDQERIDMHRKNYASQSQAAQEQQQLFSNRYTNDSNDQKANRGFEPGKISDELRQALGVGKNQLPPFIYVMRELGYPIGWLIEAQVTDSGLSVLNGEKKEVIDLENGEINEGDDDIPKIVNSPEYYAEKFIDFEGFNVPVPSGVIDETDVFGVKRYNNSMSKAEFMSKFKLRKAKKLKPRQMSVQSVKALSSEENEDETTEAETETQVDTENVVFTVETTEAGDDTIPVIEDENSQSSTDSVVIISSETENANNFQEILPGTPIVLNNSGVLNVPSSDKFSLGICEHKPYEMYSDTTGHYQNILQVTRKLKFRNNNNNNNSNTD